MQQPGLYDPLVAGATLSRHAFDRLEPILARLEHTLEILTVLIRTEPVPMITWQNVSNVAHHADLFFAQHLPPSPHRPPLPALRRSFDNTTLAVALMQRIALANELARAASKTHSRRIRLAAQRFGAIYPRGPERE